MAEPKENSDCVCTSKWDFVQFALRKGEDGRSPLERLKGKKCHELLANEVIFCLVFFSCDS